MKRRNLRVIVNGDMAIAHWLFRYTGMGQDHPPTQTCMRVTAGYERRQGRWQIVHEHCSVPFDPHTCKAVFTLEP
jgi:ketosteroid isomerase-like protein